VAAEVVIRAAFGFWYESTTGFGCRFVHESRARPFWACNNQVIVLNTMVDGRLSSPQAQAVMWQWQQLRMRKARREPKRDNFSNADLDPRPYWPYRAQIYIFLLLGSRSTKYV